MVVKELKSKIFFICQKFFEHVITWIIDLKEIKNQNKSVIVFNQNRIPLGWPKPSTQIMVFTQQTKKVKEIQILQEFYLNKILDVKMVQLQLEKLNQLDNQQIC
ncbi:unnamed protein product [Paramecium octaurelia]|uniref:Uncharacterized protein n=1 Tax=Paramecium octaurelia TaxID=43137 RepID=A0A8S1XKC4_PAROT|nr:unnamed protein product [Paramecium octaurelia]